MNKIQIDKDSILKLEELEYEIEIKENCQVQLETLKNQSTKIRLLVKSSKIKVVLQLEENSNLLINQLGIDSSIDYEVHLKENSILFCVDSILSRVDSVNKIKLIHEGNNCQTRFYTNGVNLENNKMYFYLDGVIPKNSLGVFLEENSKIMNDKEGDSKIIPNLIIDTKEVVANHSAFIGTLNKSDVFYLMSRGILKDDAKKLLIKSLLLSKMTLNTEEFIKEIAINLNMNRGGFYE